MKKLQDMTTDRSLGAKMWDCFHRHQGKSAAATFYTHTHIHNLASSPQPQTDRP